MNLRIGIRPRTTIPASRQIKNHPILEKPCLALVNMKSPKYHPKAISPHATTALTTYALNMRKTKTTRQHTAQISRITGDTTSNASATLGRDGKFQYSATLKYAARSMATTTTNIGRVQKAIHPSEYFMSINTVATRARTIVTKIKSPQH